MQERQVVALEQVWQRPEQGRQFLPLMKEPAGQSVVHWPWGLR